MKFAFIYSTLIFSVASFNAFAEDVDLVNIDAVAQAIRQETARESGHTVRKLMNRPATIENWVRRVETMRFAIEGRVAVADEFFRKGQTGLAEIELGRARGLIAEQQTLSQSLKGLFQEVDRASHSGTIYIAEDAHQNLGRLQNRNFSAGKIEVRAGKKGGAQEGEIDRYSAHNAIEDTPQERVKISPSTVNALYDLGVMNPDTRDGNHPNWEKYPDGKLVSFRLSAGQVTGANVSAIEGKGPVNPLASGELTLGGLLPMPGSGAAR